MQPQPRPMMQPREITQARATTLARQQELELLMQLYQRVPVGEYGVQGAYNKRVL